MRLRAERKVPGKAWLEFRVCAQAGDARPLLSQSAVFAPMGLPGIAYWYLLYPIHALIFRGMLRKISSLAARDHAAHYPHVAMKSGFARQFTPDR
jgi:hypothetical protein